MGKSGQAFRILQNRYLADLSTSTAMELGAALLWTADYRSAYQHFCGFMDRYPLHCDIIYGMAGVAKWCLNERNEAVNYWQEGLKCNYTDPSGVHIPLLLLFSSIIDSNLLSERDAVDIIVKYVNNPRACIWPGPLAELALNQLTEDQVRAKSIHVNPDEAERRRVDCDFYINLIKHGHDRRHSLANSMNAVSNLSWNDYTSSIHRFFGRLWQEEYYLARHYLVSL